MSDLHQTFRISPISSTNIIYNVKDDPNPSSLQSGTINILPSPNFFFLSQSSSISAVPHSLPPSLRNSLTHSLRQIFAMPMGSFHVKSATPRTAPTQILMKLCTNVHMPHKPWFQIFQTSLSPGGRFMNYWNFENLPFLKKVIILGWLYFIENLIWKKMANCCRMLRANTFR